MEIQIPMITNYDLPIYYCIMLCSNNIIILNYPVDVFRIGSTRWEKGIDGS